MQSSFDSLRVFCLATLLMACGKSAGDQPGAASSRQQRAIALAQRVIECASRNDAACLRTTTDWNDEEIAKAQTDAAERRQLLGARLSSTPQKNFWIERPGRPASDGVERRELQVRLSAIYEKDPNAVESFLVIEKAGEQRVQSFFVMSATID